MPPPTTEAPLRVAVWRGREFGALETFSVPRAPSQTVLDVVTYIQRELDPTLAYRFACRVGVCGSCAMTVNGRPRWTCRTHVCAVAREGELELRPLGNMPVIRDLVCDMDPFFDKWERARARFVPGAPRGRERDPAPLDPGSPERREIQAGIECISCGVCHAACDTVTWNPHYLGPAALNRAWTLWNDLRDGDRIGLLRAVSGEDGCLSCHTHQSCAELCPNLLNPTRAIAGLKRAVAGATLRGEPR